MPLYLSRFSYTPETWERLIGNAEDRPEAAKSYIDSAGGKLHGFWYAFRTRRLQLVGGPGQRLDGRNCDGDRWRRCTERVRNNGSAVPTARLIAAKASGRGRSGRGAAYRRPVSILRRALSLAAPHEGSEDATAFRGAAIVPYP